MRGLGSSLWVMLVGTASCGAIITDGYAGPLVILWGAIGANLLWLWIRSLFGKGPWF